MPTCAVCSSPALTGPFIATDKMYGTPGEFHYYQCDTCGCLQLPVPPADMSAYYSDNYYSMTASGNSLSTRLKYLWAAHATTRPNPIGFIISMCIGAHPLKRWMRLTGWTPASEVLDVGCGSGKLVRTMHAVGYAAVEGIDPFLAPAFDGHDGILRKSIFEHNKEYDGIMLHHSFEHMPNPLEVLKRCHSLLRPEGCLLLRIPLADSWAWRHYGVNALLIDAPRHIFLYTDASMAILAENAGFEIVARKRDSQTAQFWASIQYQKGMLHSDKRSRANQVWKRLLPPWSAVYWLVMTRILNNRNDGDQGIFVLRKKRMP